MMWAALGLQQESHVSWMEEVQDARRQTWGNVQPMEGTAPERSTSNVVRLCLEFRALKA
jgi:hypothetical protein